MEAGYLAIHRWIKWTRHTHKTSKLCIKTFQLQKHSSFTPCDSVVRTESEWFRPDKRTDPNFPLPTQNVLGVGQFLPEKKHPIAPGIKLSPKNLAMLSWAEEEPEDHLTSKGLHLWHGTYSLVSSVTMMRIGRRFIPPTQLLLHMKLYKTVVNSVPTWMRQRGWAEEMVDGKLCFLQAVPLKILSTPMAVLQPGYHEIFPTTRLP